MSVSRRKLRLAMAACIIIRRGRKRRQNRQKRKVWVRSWLLRREEYGCFNALQRELQAEDRKAFYNFLRMDIEAFNELLDKVKPLIQALCSWGPDNHYPYFCCGSPLSWCSKDSLIPHIDQLVSAGFLFCPPWSKWESIPFVEFQPGFSPQYHPSFMHSIG